MRAQILGFHYHFDVQSASAKMGRPGRRFSSRSSVRPCWQNRRGSLDLDFLYE